MSATSEAPRGPGGIRLPGGIRDRMNDVVSQLAAAGALIVVFIALSIASPYFLTSNNLFNVVVQIADVDHRTLLPRRQTRPGPQFVLQPVRPFDHFAGGRPGHRRGLGAGDRHPCPER